MDEIKIKIEKRKIQYFGFDISIIIALKGLSSFTEIFHM